MKRRITLEDYKRAYRKIEIEDAKMGFIIHLIVYILVNVILIYVNIIYVPKVIWFFYPLAGWSIFLIIHYLFGVRWLDKRLSEKEARAEYLAKESVGR